MRIITTLPILLSASLFLSACIVPDQSASEPIPSAQSLAELPTRMVEASDDLRLTSTEDQLASSSLEIESTEIEVESPTETAPPPTSTPLPTAEPPTPVASPAPPTSEPTAQPTADPSGQYDSSAWRLFNFEENAEVVRWIIVNDTVMGGISTAEGSLENGYVLFEGELSLDNNGGFTSMRGPLNADLSEFAGLRMRVRGDGRSYFLRLRDLNEGNIGIAHEEVFDTAADEWVVIEIPFADLDPVYRGVVVNRPPLDPSRVATVGIMLREKAEGPFRLEIDWIEAYTGGSVASLR